MKLQTLTTVEFIGRDSRAGRNIKDVLPFPSIGEAQSAVREYRERDADYFHGR